MAEIAHFSNGFAGRGVLHLWRRTRADPHGKARHCGQSLANPRPGPQREARRWRRGAAWHDYDGGWPARLERHRRLDRWEVLPKHACAVSNVRYTLSSRGLAAIWHHDPRPARQEALRHWTACGHRRYVYSSNIEGSGDFSRAHPWIIRRYGYRAFCWSPRCFRDAHRSTHAGNPRGGGE